MVWSFSHAKSVFKGVAEFVETLAPVMSLLEIKKLRDVVGGVAADTAKVTINKRFHKREYGQAFSKLTRKEKDAILAIQKELRRLGFLENFVLNVALYGENIEDSTELLRMLSQYGPAEAIQLIDDMDLEKAPVNHVRDAAQKTRAAFAAAGRAAKDGWNSLDAALEPEILTMAHAIDNLRIRAVADNFGIEQPLYRRITNIRVTQSQLRTLAMALLIVAAVIVILLGGVRLTHYIQTII